MGFVERWPARQIRAALAGVRLGASAKRVVPVEAVVERPAKRARPAAGLAPFEGHGLAKGAGFLVCLKCGEAFSKGKPPGAVCGGFLERLPVFVELLLGRGALDTSVAGSDRLLELAARRGRPVPPAAGAARAPAPD